MIFHRSTAKILCLSGGLLMALLLSDSSVAAPQKQSVVSVAAPMLTRTATRHESRRFAYGGTVTVVGAPQGSIAIEGWSRSEVEITADIELRADTEEDLNLLATVNRFVFDEDMNHLRILTTGSHDKVFMRRVAKDFPKRLLGLPWKIDYRIRVPVFTDLEINAGRGAINLSGVEGAIQLSATESETTLSLIGGTVNATIGWGKVSVRIPVRSWRGGGADIRLAAGDLTVELPPGFNGDIDADILQSGHIDESYGALEARERPGLTPQAIKARAGVGGAFFRFKVGDGTLYIKKAVTDREP
jgi:hypothetical protein